MSKKHKKVLTSFESYWSLAIGISTITGFVSISASASLVGVLIGISSSATGVKICVITAAIKMHKSKKIKKNQET